MAKKEKPKTNFLRDKQPFYRLSNRVVEFIGWHKDKQEVWDDSHRNRGAVVILDQEELEALWRSISRAAFDCIEDSKFNEAFKQQHRDKQCHDFMAASLAYFTPGEILRGIAKVLDKEEKNRAKAL